MRRNEECGMRSDEWRKGQCRLPIEQVGPDNGRGAGCGPAKLARCAAGAGGTPAPQRLGAGRSLLFTPGKADTRRSLGS